MEEMIEIFKAFSDPIRLRILNLLFTGELCVCNIVDILDLPQSTISRHLSILKGSGIISSRKSGLWHYYKLNDNSTIAKETLAILNTHGTDQIFINDHNRLKNIQLCSTAPGETCSA